MCPSDAPLDALFAALAKARAEFAPVVKAATNPHFRSKYAQLDAYLDACVPALCKHGLSVVQRTSIREGALVLETVLYHASGASLLLAEYPVSMLPASPQALGSALTYARRYSLACGLGMAAEDDDGEAAEQRVPERQREPEPVRVISREQRDTLHTAAKELGLKPAIAKDIIHNVGGVPDSRSLPAEKFEAVLSAFAGAAKPAEPDDATKARQIADLVRNNVEGLAVAVRTA